MCFRINQKLASHLQGKDVTRASRQTKADWGSCVWLPGEQGQHVYTGLGLGLEGASYPVLLSWTGVMCLEGATLVQQRQLLSLLGYVVPFKWRVPGSTAHVNPVSISVDLSSGLQAVTIFSCSLRPTHPC